MTNNEEIKVNEAEQQSETVEACDNAEAAVDWQAQYDALKADHEAQCNKYLRMLAEYDNYRKRTQADAEKHRMLGISSTLVAILPVIDSINRALEVLKEDDKAQEGIQQIKKQFEQSLSKLGVEEIKALGEEFDPTWHNAVMQQEDADNAGKVIQVFQAGYKYGDYVIRPAMVKVAV